MAMLAAASLAILAPGATSPARADDKTPASQPSQQIIYQAPPKAEKGTRVDGHMRGSLDGLPSLYILAPDHTGLTVQEQPPVFWYLSKPTGTRFVATITQDSQTEPVMDLQLDASKSGIQRLDLGKQNVKLQIGVEYTLSLALVPDSQHRAKDLFCSALIKRVDPPDALMAQLVTRANPMDRAVTYARNGIWYDALAILSRQIDDQNPNQSLREQRAALLDQVSLGEAATFDRTANPLKNDLMPDGKP
jgi:hypothetical protein